MIRARRGGERGFTLMEMLIVLVVIGLISAVAIPQVMRLLAGAKWKAAKIQLETVSQSLHAYQLDVGTYPTAAEGLGALWKAPAGIDAWIGPYVREEKQTEDPWGRAIVYKPSAGGDHFEIGTLGADGKPGGTGDDADLSRTQ